MTASRRFFTSITICAVVCSLSVRLFAQSPVAPAAAEKNVEVWKKADSPIWLAADKLVAPLETLIIEPGVTVALEPGARIIVQGKLLAIGLESDSGRITFTSTRDILLDSFRAAAQKALPPFEAGRDEWDAIIFSNPDREDPSILYHCELRYAEQAVVCSSSFPVLSRVKIGPRRRGLLSINGGWQTVFSTFSDYGPRKPLLGGSLTSAARLSTRDTLAVRLTLSNSAKRPVGGLKLLVLDLLSDRTWSWITMMPDTWSGRLDPGQEESWTLRLRPEGTAAGKLTMRILVTGSAVDNGELFASSMVWLPEVTVEPPLLPQPAPVDQLAVSAGEAAALPAVVPSPKKTVTGRAWYNSPWFWGGIGSTGAAVIAALLLNNDEPPAAPPAAGLPDPPPFPQR